MRARARERERERERRLAHAWAPATHCVFCGMQTKTFRLSRGPPLIGGGGAETARSEFHISHADAFAPCEQPTNVAQRRTRERESLEPANRADRVIRGDLRRRMVPAPLPTSGHENGPEGLTRERSSGAVRAALSVRSSDSRFSAN